MTDYYIIVDKRTNKQSCSGIWSKKNAEGKIEEFKRRQEKGGRPDISKEDVENLEIRPLNNETTSNSFS